MRGEYGDSDGDGEAVGELPPHARRILPGAAVDEHGGGTTSACAENTEVTFHFVPFCSFGNTKFIA